MKQSEFLITNEPCNFTFKTANTRDNSALLAKEMHTLAFIFTLLGEGSALFHKKDCFECLSPHKIAS